MSKQQTAVEWLVQQYIDENYGIEVYEQAKQMEKERASTFGIRVFPECSSLKTGRVEIDLHKFETLLNEMYGE
jgi:hypothetical protein